MQRSRLGQTQNMSRIEVSTTQRFSSRTLILHSIYPNVSLLSRNVFTSEGPVPCLADSLYITTIGGARPCCAKNGFYCDAFATGFVLFAHAQSSSSLPSKSFCPPSEVRKANAASPSTMPKA